MVVSIQPFLMFFINFYQIYLLFYRNLS